MPDNNQEKTEPASQKRKEEAREKGQVARSMEVNSAFIFFMTILYFAFGGSWMINEFKNLMVFYFQSASNPILTDSQSQSMLKEIIFNAFKLLLPFSLVMMVGGLAANLSQIGFLFTTQPLIPELKKINPFSGLKKIFSRRSLVEFLKSLAKIIVVTIISYWAITAKIEEIFLSSDMSIPQIAIFTKNLIFSVYFKILVVLVIIAFIDFLFQRWDLNDNLKMTKQEVKEEMKQYEGDPLIKSRIRSIQREMARKRMLQEVPKAEVVITNPTHLAIAIKYQPEEDPAPRICAKGADFLAEKIRNIAKENSIPLVENKPLAQTLYKTCEVGDFVPEELYTAVAEILSYVYKLKGKKIG